jgi:hypothetical protein
MLIFSLILPQLERGTCVRNESNFIWRLVENGKEWKTMTSQNGSRDVITRRNWSRMGLPEWEKEGRRIVTFANIESPTIALNMPITNYRRSTTPVTNERISSFFLSCMRMWRKAVAWDETIGYKRNEEHQINYKDQWTLNQWALINSSSTSFPKNDGYKKVLCIR